MNYNYSTKDYADAIERETQKRRITYPKIIHKMEKKGESTWQKSEEFSYLIELLAMVDNVLNGFGLTIYTYDVIHDGFSELIREYKMRVKYYPRWIWIDRSRSGPRMTQKTADYELAVWRELCIYYAETFLGSAQIALDALESKTRKRHADSR